MVELRSPPLDPPPTPVALHVRRWGPTSGKRALLVHGVASYGGTWWQVAEALASRGYRVSAPDLRGHGLSPDSSALGLVDFAADIVELDPSEGRSGENVDDSPKRPWDLVIGHSLGGPIVCSALAAGLKSSAVVLVDPLLEYPDRDLAAFVAEQVSEADAFADPTMLQVENPHWHSLDAHHAALARRFVAGWTVEQALMQNAPWDKAGLTQSLTMPSIVLGAEPGLALCLPELGHRICAAQPNVDFQVVPGSSHGIPRDNPNAVIAAALSLAPSE